MIGSIIGDICGSTYEFDPIKLDDFNLIVKESDYTDDTVLTIAIADAFLNKKDLKKTLVYFSKKYTGRGYGTNYCAWVYSYKHKPYNSYGNGSAMRVSSISYIYDNEEDVLKKAKDSAIVTHNHEEGIKGAQATSLVIFMAKQGFDKKEIKERIIELFNYDLNRTYNEVKEKHKWNEICQKTVPEAIICFLESKDYESTIRNAIALKGDSDTLACIAGGMAEAFYGVESIPSYLIDIVNEKLPNEFKKIINEIYIYDDIDFSVKINKKLLKLDLLGREDLLDIM